MYSDFFYFNVIKERVFFPYKYMYFDLYNRNPNPMSIFVSRKLKPSIIRKTQMSRLSGVPVQFDENG